MNEKGERRTFWVPNDLDNLIEEVRKKLGMSKSSFYRYAVIRLLEEMSVLSTKAKEGMHATIGEKPPPELSNPT